MNWVTVMCPDGPYEINPEGVARLIRTYAHARAVAENSKIVVEPQGTPWDKLPDLSFVHTDWPRVRNQRENIVTETGNVFYSRMSTNMRGAAAIAHLEGLLGDRDGYTAGVLDQQKKATRTSMAGIAGHVQSAQFEADAAILIRNAAIETELVLVSAVLLPEVMAAKGAINAGKAATAAFGLVAGSVGKGVAKWQDTESVGLGVAEGATELVLNTLSFGLKSKLKLMEGVSKAGKLTVVLLFGVIKGAIKMGPASYISPEDMARGKQKTTTEILIPGAAEIPSAFLGEISKALVKSDLLAIPVTIALKLALKWGTKTISKPAAPPQPSGAATFRGPTMLHHDYFQAGRKILRTLSTSPLLDAAKPQENFVLKWALRPLDSH